VWITSWQHISPDVTVKGVQKCCVSNAMDGTNDDSCGMAMKSVRMLGVSVRKMNALTVKIETDG
jgi:hypothetical protein